MRAGLWAEAGRRTVLRTVTRLPKGNGLRPLTARRSARKGVFARQSYCIWTVPLTVTLTVVLPASTGSAASAEAIAAWARSIGAGA